MKRNPFFRFVRGRTVQHKFNIVIVLIVIILSFSLLDFWFGVKVMSGIRAYVGGEGLWSKAQKESVNHLNAYIATGDAADYQQYVHLLQVPDGDKQARLELDKQSPDYARIRAGFIQGGNDAADVDDMTFLYRQFHTVSYMSAAIETWSEGDDEIANLRDVGNQIHQLITHRVSSSPIAQATRAAELAGLSKQVATIDGHLTVLEDRFSSTLGEGSRSISSTLLHLTLFTTGLLGLLAVIIAALVGKAIVKLDKSKTEFVSLVSHQLRTPLTAINWYTEALLSGTKGKLSAGQQEYMAELSSGGKRMSGLISDILKVSSLDLGTYKAETTQINLTKIVQTAIKDQQASIDQKSIAIFTSVESDLPDFKADEQLLVAIFQNLLSNSVKYTPNGGRITVEVSRQHKQLLIHLADTGIGIPETQQPQIFTKMFRADNAKQLDADGSGLGLYIVHASVDRMRGTIWFTSHEGRGSDFYVKLPVYRGKYGRSNG